MIDKNYFNNEKQTEKYVEKLRIKVDIVFESVIMPFLFISATLVFFCNSGKLDSQEYFWSKFNNW